jgi:hypothetical protein
VVATKVTIRWRRFRRALALCAAAIVVCALTSRAAAQTAFRPPDAGGDYSGTSYSELPYRTDAPVDQVPTDAMTPDDGQQIPYAVPGDGGPGGPTGPNMNPQCPPPRCLPLLQFFGLRHSYTDGRNVGYGWPLVGTSWLNRPYYVGGTLGVLGVADHVDEHVREDVDTFGSLLVGWDWDYYWGTELQFERATPELTNDLHPDVRSGNAMNIWSYDAMYYPWGDSAVRPFWRFGLGWTRLDYVTDEGHRRDEELWTFPIGIGIKYPIYPWLAGRLEFTDHLALGNSGVNTLNDLTLACGLEWHFGGHPQSYWPWNPSRHVW